MRKPVRWIAGFIASCLSVALALPVGAADKTTITLALWSESAGWRDAWIGMVDSFEAQNPDISVEILEVPNNQFIDRLLAMIATGTAPDVVRMTQRFFAGLADQDVFLDLGPYMERTSELADIPQLLIDMWNVDGKYLGVPFDYNPNLVSYNLDRYDEAGLPYPERNWTWDDLVDNGKKLTRRNSAGEVTQYGFRSPWNLLPLETWARAGGSYIVSDDRKQSGLTTRKTMEAIQFLQDLSYQHEIMPPVGVPLPGISLNAGTLAMQHDGHWNVPVLLETEGLRWAMADYPHRAGEERRTVFGGGSFSVTKATKHPDAAWKLALFVSSDEAQRAIVQNGISMPVRRSMMEYAVTSTAQYDQRIFVEALEYAVPNPVFPNYLEAQRILNQGLAPVRTGQRGALEYIPSIAQAFAEAIY